jgi:hypothetical protein
MRHVPAAAIDSGQQQFIIDNALALSKMTLSLNCRADGRPELGSGAVRAVLSAEPSATRFVGSFPDRVRSDP